MQIKTTMRYVTSHLSEWLSSINQQTTSAGKDVEKEELLHCWQECGLVQPLWKRVCRYLKKLKIEPPDDLVIPLLTIYPKKPQTLIWKSTCTPMFIAALLAKAKIWKQPKCPSVGKWIKTWWYIHTMECYSAIKKKNGYYHLQQYRWT